MMTFHYQYDEKSPEVTIKLPSPDITVGEALEAFASFLRGCGYGIEGDLVLEPEEVNVAAEEETYRLDETLEDNLSPTRREITT
jgi:hypothetical protein